MKFAVAFLLLSFTQFSQALEENKVFETVTNAFESETTCEGSDQKFWQLRMVEAPIGAVPASYPPFRSYHLRFSQYGCEIGDKGSIVLAPGRGESSIEYFETAIDFVNMGYSPVFVIDHRGQGFSPRLLPDQDKGHIGDFQDYVNDFAAATDAIESILEAEFSRYDEPLFYTSNSMGGAIGIGYFQMMGKRHPYQSAAILGPMIYVNYASFLDPKKEPLLRAALINAGNKMEFLTNMIARQRCNNGQCEEYSSKSFAAYDPDRLQFQPDTEKIMTHSEDRFNLKKYFWNTVDWSGLVESHYQQGEIAENWSSVVVGGATNQFARESSRQNEMMRTPTELAKMVTTPLLMITGTRDLRAYREYSKARQAWRKLRGLPPTDLSRHIQFCNDLNKESQEMLQKDSCTFVPLEGAFHEIYKESDVYRDVGMQLVDEFFMNSL
ncbi:MAG: alpha/beta hydrolase [Pseudomonadota bacterium]